MSLGRLFFIGAVLLALAYFALRAPVSVADPRFLKQEFRAFDAQVAVSIYLDEGTPRERGHEALADCEKFLLGYEQTWAPAGKGLLADVNRALAGGQTFSMSGPSAALFVRAEELRAGSDGLFDARLGALNQLWGFTAGAPLPTAPPPADRVRALTGAVLRAAPFREGETYGPAAGVQWDFRGFIRGAAAEEVIARLKARGIKNATVNIGGKLRAIGARGTAPWRIGIRNPRGTAPTDVVAYFLTDGDDAVMTSADYESSFEHNGRRYHPFIDPRTGMPGEGLRAVTVAHDDAVLADAASHALFVAGPMRWREAAAALGITDALVVASDGAITTTATFARRLKFLNDVEPRVVP